jgi:hypothetical protein
MKLLALKLHRYLDPNYRTIAVRFAVLVAVVAVVGLTAYSSLHVSFRPGF